VRNRGMRFECLRLRPHDHVGWVFSGQAEFDALAESFLAEGAARGERLMYIAADPGPAAVASLRTALGADAVRVTSIAEVYGASGIVDAAAQRATFAAALADARVNGYSGIRVAADNTPMVTDDQRMAAWVRWEIAADRFMSENPVTGLCAFNADKVDVNRLRHLSTLHPLSPADCPEPQFRVFTDDGNLCVEGRIDSFTVTGLPVYLDVLPPKTGVLIDLAAATLASRAALIRLGSLAGTGVTVTVRGSAAALDHLAAAGLPANERLILQPTSVPAAPAAGAAGSSATSSLMN
jgi:MEDS: MEthanogen/methylotroph, DcmR Sensory domain